MSNLNIDYIFDLDDAVLRDAATAFPRIQTLALRSFHAGTPSKVTIHGFLDLIAKCPCLSHPFQMDIHVSMEDLQAAKKREPVVPNTQIRHLILESSTAEEDVDAAEFANILFRVFPKLHSLECCEETDMWDELQSLIQAGKWD
jgi:hypothetical protein